MTDAEIPSGWVLEGNDSSFDPIKPLLEAGLQITNGFRTPADIERLRHEGYTPATNSDHLSGDAVDLTPGKTGWGLDRVAEFARQYFPPEANIDVHNGTHVHVSLKGWGQAPGTPGTKYSGLPPIPDGFQLEQRGSLAGDSFATQEALPPPPEAPKPQGLSDEDFSRQLGAIASDPTLSPDARYARLSTLSQTAGRPIDEGDLRRIADAGRGLVQYDPGGNGQAGSVAAPQVAPIAYAPAPADVPQPVPEQDRRLLGLNRRVRAFVNSTRISNVEQEGAARDKLWGFLKRYGVDPEANPADAALIPQVNEVLKWRRENPGRPYTGKVSLENLVAQARAPQAPPPSTPEEENRARLHDSFGDQQLTGAYTPDHPFGRNLKENIWKISSDAGFQYPDRMAEESQYIPLVGGAEMLQQSKQDISRGNYGVGAVNAILGGMDFLPGGKGLKEGVHVLDAAALREAGAGAEAITRATADEALSRGGSAVVHIPGEEPAVVSGPGLIDAAGRRWTAADIAERGGKLEVTIPPGAPVVSGTPTIGRHGPVHYELANDYQAGLRRLSEDQSGELPGAIQHPQIGPVDIVWGDSRYGLSKIVQQHPEVVSELPSIVERLPVVKTPAESGNNRFVLEDANYRAVVSPDFHGDEQRWLVTAFERKGPGGQTSRRDPLSPDGVSTGADAANIGAEVVPINRERDYLHVGGPGTMPAEEPAIGRTRRMNERPTAQEMADAARKVAPGDVVPVPANTIGSMEEAARANPGRFVELKAPDEFAALPVRTVTAPTGGKVHVRGPLDITQSLRLMGGVKDDGGDLAHLGITNEARRMQFGSNEQFLGKLINNHSGMSLDDAALTLWEEGYFPGFRDRPTPADLVDRLHDESTGAQRYFHPDDLAAVADFQAAQAERGRIDAAEAKGTPLVEDRSQPITPQDLEANRPPATAYEDLPTLGGKVGNINLDNVETKNDISRLLRVTESRMGGFDAARRGVISHAETEALASELNMTADDLLQRRHGQALNSEQALAARRILAKSSDEVVTFAKKVAQGGSSDADVATFQKVLLRHAAIQEQVTGATAEAGRALNQFKIVAKAERHRARVMRAIIDGAGGRNSLEETADLILNLQREPGKMNRFVLDAWKPTWKDKLVELWYNSLLSGPQTHAVNILSNAITAGAQIPEHAFAAAIGGARSLVAKARGKEAFDRVYGNEIGARTIGLLQGAREGAEAFKKTLLTGEQLDSISKIESARHEAIDGLKGKVIRTPTRLLSAEDEFFKATARRMEIAGLAVRQAKSEGLRGDAFKARVVELTANPSDETVAKAMDYARYLTFQRELGPSMRHVQAIIQQHPWLKLFVPFVRTPTNLVKFAVERSPLGFMLREVRADMKAGGARRDLAVAKMALGTGVGMGVAEMVSRGVITGGGPADENAKRLRMADGWQPYSILIGGKYYSYKRLDPLSTTLGVVADMVDLQSAMTEGQRAKIVPLVLASITQNLANKTWLSGLSDVFNVISDPVRYSKGFIERLVGSIAVPALLAQTARTIDPVQRKTATDSLPQGMLDAIRARIPGVSKGLLPKRDVFGEEIKNEGGLGPDFISPIWTSTPRRDAVVREVQGAGAVIGPVSRRVKGARLPDKMYDLYQSYAGQLTRQYIQQDIASPDWQSLSAADRKTAIDRAKKAARSDARDALFQAEQ